jgi:septal ring factor EnvC (AmiA/AmiB activator)
MLSDIGKMDTEKKNNNKKDEDETSKESTQKKKLQQLKKELSVLLETPLVTLAATSKSRENRAKGGKKKANVPPAPVDFRKRKTGFFVYTPGK